MHYRFDLARHSYEALTSSPARSYVGGFDGDGRQVVYASTRRNREDFDLYVVDVTKPASDRRVLEADGEFWPDAFSPDGRFALITRSTSHTSSEVYWLDVETGTTRRVLEEFGPIGVWDAEWSSDGRTIYLASELDREFVGVHAFDTASGRTTLLTPGLEWDVNAIEMLADGRTLALLVNEDARPSLYLLDSGRAHLRRARNPPQGYLSSIAAHPEARRLAVDIISPLGVPGVWVYDVDSDEFSPWAVPEPDASPLPDASVIRYPTFDLVGAGMRRRIPAIVFPASGEFAGPRPVMIDIHGGPASQSTVAPAPHYEMARRLGVTVISPNVRGSRGYGETYASLDDGRRREDAVRDIGALLDWIAVQPALDAGRVVVTGGSYGGYLTLASLARYSDRIRYGFELFGISDFVTFLESSQEEHFPDSQRAEFGDERDPAMRAFLESISPASHAGRIRAPLLIFQGVNDVRVKPQQSRHLVEQIRHAGGAVAYVEAANEGHGLEQPLNQLYVGALASEFMERCATR